MILQSLRSILVSLKKPMLFRDPDREPSGVEQEGDSTPSNDREIPLSEFHLHIDISF